MSENEKGPTEGEEKLKSDAPVESPADVMERKLKQMREERVKEKQQRKIQEKKFNELVEPTTAVLEVKLSPDQEKDKKITDLTNKNSALLLEIDQIKVQFAKVEQQRNELEAKSISAECNYSQLKNESSTSVNELVTKLSATSNNYSESVKALAQAKVVIDDLENKLKELQRDSGQLKDANQSFDRTKLLLEKQLAEAEKRLAESEKKVAEAELKRMVVERQSMEVAKNIAESKFNYGEFKNLITDLELKIAQAEKKNNELTNLLSIKDKKIGNSERALDDAQKKVGELSEKVSESRVLETKIAGLEKKITALEEDKKVMEAKFQESPNTVGFKADQLPPGAMKDLVQELQMKVDRQKKEILVLQEKSKGSDKTERSNFADLVGELRAKVERLTIENTRLKSEVILLNNMNKDKEEK